MFYFSLLKNEYLESNHMAYARCHGCHGRDVAFPISPVTYVTEPRHLSVSFVKISLMVSPDKISRLFPSFEKGLVDSITEKSQVFSFKEGDLLMKTGQNIRSTILVLDGRIKIFREDQEGNEFFMYYLHPGQACALSMICATKKEASQIMARAATSTEILSIPIEYMDAWMLTFKSWYYFVLETYRSNFEELLLTVDHIAFRNMDERLYFYLKRQQQTLKSNILHISNTEIATELNSSREVISRLLKKMAERGCIKINRQQIELIDLKIS